MTTLLSKTRELNRIIQKAAGHPISFTEIADALRKIVNTNVYIFSRKGRVWGYSFLENFYCPIMEDIIKLDAHYPEQYNEEFLQLSEPRLNIDRKGVCAFDEQTNCFLKDKFSAVVPIVGGNQRLGTLLLSKSGRYCEEDLILAEFCAAIISMEIQRARVEKSEDEARKRAVVTLAFETLSYSELEAARQIFNELDGSNGLLVASKIADKVGITRSVIVNALRKLESAGVIEVRSLGMKGTHIRILNDYLAQELENNKATRIRF